MGAIAIAGELRQMRRVAGRDVAGAYLEGYRQGVAERPVRIAQAAPDDTAPIPGLRETLEAADRVIRAQAILADVADRLADLAGDVRTSAQNLPDGGEPLEATGD